MECPATKWLSNEEYLKQFNRKVAQQRIPLSGSIELTRRCNLRCVHCYLGATRNGAEELNTTQWHSIIDEITEAGCLYLLITGGEPLLRKDFAEIYSHARTNGMVVTVFTNGTLITDEIIELFQELPPRMVEISVYGATADTYERITGVKGTYEHCLHGIQQLLKKNIRLGLKTILMTYNRHEFYEIEKMAEAYGVRFRFDGAIFPCFNGDKTPITLRVAPEEIVEKEFSDETRSQKWKEFFERMQGASVSDALYQCGAGLAHFHITPYGNLQPCLMVTSPQYNLLDDSFIAGWNDVIPGIREKKAQTEFPCNHCKKRTLCGFCPAFFELENDSEVIASEYLCVLGEYRFHKITDQLIGEGNYVT